MSGRKTQKRLTTRSVTQMRASFEARICDDLCEELLRYLSLEDRFRLECVSKQFQRTIYAKQYDLTIDYPLKIRLRRQSSSWRVFAIDWTALETIVKKCRHIRTINLNNIYFSCNKVGFRREYNKLVSKLAEECNNLTDFECYTKKLNKKTIKLVSEKLGSKVVSFRFLHSEEKFDKSLLISLTKVKDISLNSYHAFRLSNIFTESECLAKSLLKFSLNYDNNDLKLFEKFAESNKTLESLSINSYSTDEKAVHSLLLQIANLKNLKKLYLVTDLEIRDKSFAKGLRVMAKNCPKLKKLYFNLFVDSDNHSLVLEMIDSLKHFQQLKSIHLSLDTDFDLDLADDEILISSKTFGVCKHLTHLSVYSNEINDSFFADIAKHLPNLKDLNILNANITTQTLDQISQLKNIEWLSFYQKYSMVRLEDTSIDQMYDRCKKLKSIKFSP